MNTVYVLGAGASKHVGYPLASTMGAKMLAWMSTRDRYRDTAEAIKETFGDSPNIEDVITALDDITALEGAKELEDRRPRTIAAFQRGQLAEVVPQWFNVLDRSDGRLPTIRPGGCPALPRTRFSWGLVLDAQKAG